MITYDILLKNATIDDGTGRPPYRADIYVHNGKIASIEQPGTIVTFYTRCRVNETGNTFTADYFESRGDSEMYIRANPAPAIPTNAEPISPHEEPPQCCIELRRLETCVMPTDVRERGLEDTIVGHLVDDNGFELGVSVDYDRNYALDTGRLFRFLEATQSPKLAELGEARRAAFLGRLQGEITKRGVVDVLRRGVKDRHLHFDLFYATASPTNVDAVRLHGANIFSVVRQLHYSRDNADLSLDLCLLLNGLPIATCELKNSLSGQTVANAVWQYKTDRDSRDLLFAYKRCMVHFAVDDRWVKFCTKLDGKRSWFLPFDRGHNGGAGNPPCADGLMTGYLWREVWTKPELCNIIENYAQVVESKDAAGRKVSRQIFPRYHQLSVVKQLLADVVARGVGRRYLVQHSAGSGKSNSIAWLAHQLVGVGVFDTVVVVTDRVNLDRQIRDTIQGFQQLRNTVEWAEDSAGLRRAMEQGRKIIVTTVHKFPYVLSGMQTDYADKKFAIIIDEAHSSQSGSLAAKMNAVLAGTNGEESESAEDMINRLIESRRLVQNGSYFAFTATPKHKTLELFGEKADGAGDVISSQPFHVYTMKQAIEEGFILDVLKHFTSIKSYYKLAKAVEDDPLFDRKKAQGKLRAYVEGHEFAIGEKAEIMVEHFHRCVADGRRLGGQARAMVVTGGIEKAIKYYIAIEKHLRNRNSQYRAMIAFSGEKAYGGKTHTEASINGFASSEIEKRFRDENEMYRFLVVADKFQTGYDEPLLHTMYVDKVLTDIKAVQTLSRLNRAHPQKDDTFILDFVNDPEAIREAFEQYHKCTMLEGETDPNRLNDLVATMQAYDVFTDEDVRRFADLYLTNAPREQLEPILDACADNYNRMYEAPQVEFKAAAKMFVRTYGFLGLIMPFGNPQWERLHIFLKLLVPKLPSPKEDDLAAGVAETVDLYSYRTHQSGDRSLQLGDEDAVLEPMPDSRSGGKPEPEMDSISKILADFNDMFGNIEWEDRDNIERQVRALPAMVRKNEKYQNAIKDSDKQNARVECDRALATVMKVLLNDNLELFRQYSDNTEFRTWMTNMVFRETFTAPRSNTNSGIETTSVR